MTGYQEILTDPSYAGQIITFTFPHIGNVGDQSRGHRDDDPGGARPGDARRRSPSRPITARRSRSTPGSSRTASIGLCRRRHAAADPAHPRPRRAERRSSPMRPDGKLDIAALRDEARAWPGLEGMDLAQRGHLPAELRLGRDRLAARARLRHARTRRAFTSSRSITAPSATSCGCWPRMAAGSPWCRRPRRAEDILRHKPDGVFLSNGPGDPAATGEYAVPVLRELIDQRQADVRHLPRPPDAGAGARRQDQQDGQAAIAAPTTRSRTWRPARSRSPARTTASSSTPTACRPGSSRRMSRCSTAPTRACAIKGKPVFSVQHHPEASPGPQDSHYLFERFVELMEAREVRRRQRFLRRIPAQGRDRLSMRANAPASRPAPRGLEGRTSPHA